MRLSGAHDPDDVVDAIIDIALDPRDELAVGWNAKASCGSHRRTPDIAERMSAEIAHTWQIEDAPPAPLHPCDRGLLAAQMDRPVAQADGGAAEDVAQGRPQQVGAGGRPVQAVG